MLYRSPKLFLLRFWNTFLIAYTRRKISFLARSNKVIYLTPVKPRGCGGHIDEYYHFIFDLLVPLDHLIRETPSDVVFAFQKFGINTDRLQRLFPGRIKIVSDTSEIEHLAHGKLIGMNPRGIFSRPGAYENFKNNIFENLQIDQDNVRKKVLLIERMPPDSHFLENATVTHSGSLRRSILNHADLNSLLQGMVKAPYEFHNLQLEKIPFVEQMQYFDSALVVIGQHGAGLANCIWMKPESIVIELNQTVVSQFNMISTIKKHQYYTYITSSLYVEVDTNDFEHWIMGNDNLREIFKNS